jgi:hypothetical protein
MINLCTLFDSNYMSRGLVMHDSLLITGTAFHLFIYAFDDDSYVILDKLKLRNVTLISLKEFENENLLAVKAGRTRAEYCWTCTSSIIKYTLDKFSVTSCTYVDADTYFYSSPEILLDELNDDKSVLITSHGYSGLTGIFEEKRAGRFCVQFTCFRNDRAGREILDKWISQCIAWCYNRYEDGKFGDQKYLDTWPVDYPSVHILENPGGGVAPWNVSRYQLSKIKEEYSLYEKKTGRSHALIFFHFHFVRLAGRRYADIGWNPINQNIVNLLYMPYIQMIIKKDDYLKSMFPHFTGIAETGKVRGVKELIKNIFKKCTRYNILRLRTT